MNRWAVFLLIALGLMVVATTWYSMKLGMIKPVVVADIAQTADAFGVSIVTTDAAGALSYDGQATEATQAGTGIVDFYNLRARSYGETNVVWWLWADQGVMSQDRQRIDLSGHVKLVRIPALSTAPRYIFTTNSATVFPETKMVQGSDWLTISQEGTKNILVGRGFIVNMVTKTFQLLGQVRGVYFEQSQKQK